MKPVRMAAVLLITLLALYPLSMGPGYRLDFALRAGTFHVEHLPRYSEPSKAFIVCYYPLIWLSQKYPQTGPTIDCYLRLWFPADAR